MTAKIPDFGNKLAGGIPLVADVKDLQLNVSLAGDPAVTPAHLVLHDWGRFQSPHGSWEECPYRRTPPRDAPPGGSAAGGAGRPWRFLFPGGGAPQGAAASRTAAVAAPGVTDEGSDPAKGAGAGRRAGRAGTARALAEQAPGQHAEGGKRRGAMLTGLIDQSIVNWCAAGP
jgi:hypothetical protein